jgi:hypothetical protein
MTAIYDPRNWYWVASNRPSFVYSSAAAQWISESDGGYQGWIAQENSASGGDYMMDGEIAQVLAAAGLEGRVVLNVQPQNWGNVQTLDLIDTVQRAGCVASATGQYSALNGHYQTSGEPYATMASTQVYINAHGQLPNNQPLPWAAYSGQVTFQDAGQFTAVYQGLENYIQAWKTWAYHGGTMPSWGGFTVAAAANIWGMVKDLTSRIEALEANVK